MKKTAREDRAGFPDSQHHFFQVAVQQYKHLKVALLLSAR